MQKTVNFFIKIVLNLQITLGENSPKFTVFSFVSMSMVYPFI